MKLLLDTHAFLWWVSDDARLSRRALGAIADDRNEVLFSTVSAWELMIKSSLGRVEFGEPAEDFIPRELGNSAFDVLPVYLRHVLAMPSLPEIHRDPFDRLLVAQAVAEGAALVSADRKMHKYPAEIVW